MTPAQYESLPSRERGLKCRHVNVYSQHVAPLAGARIEIWYIGYMDTRLLVAPLAGARIEIR